MGGGLDRVDGPAPARLDDGWFRQVFDASPVPTVISRIADGLVLGVNAAYATALGWQPETMLGRTSADLDLWRDPAQRVVMRAMLGRSGEVRNFAADLRGAAGDTRRILLSARTVRINGEPCVVGSMVDVSDQRRAEEELRSSEQRLRLLIEGSTDYAIFMLDVDGAVASWNPAAEQITGYRGDDVLHRHFSVFYPPQSIAAHHPEHELEIAAQAGRYAEEGWRIRKDGVPFWASIVISSLRDSAGVLRGYMKVVRDLTEQKAAEDALRASEERFRQLAERMTDAVVLWSADPPAVYYVSPAFEPITGIPGETFVRAPATVLGLLHTDDLDRARATWAAVATEREPNEEEFRIVRPDGELRWIRVRHITLTPDSTGTRRYAAVLEDATVRREKDEAQQAARRTAEEANRAKDDFLSRMSHELRTPLNAVLGFAELLELDDLTADQADGIHHIRKSGEHLLQLINEVLDIARIDSGHLALSPEPVNLNELVIETMDLLRPLARPSGIRMVFDAAAATWLHVQADRQRLRQILLNLLSNSIKYNRPSGSITVDATVLPDDRVAVHVTDTGMGIAATDLPRLFQPFDRLGVEVSGIEGTGVGLALSRRLAEAMGGSLTAASALGQGSTFTVVLPQATQPTSSGPDAAGPDEPPAADDAERGNLRSVLYIEDNTSNLHLVEKVLHRRRGWRLIHAGLGQLGLDLAAVQRPDLVLLDLHLPDMPGIEVLRRLRSDPATADAPIVVVSADATPGQVARLIAAGADEYVTKPIGVAALLELLDRISAALA